MNLYEHTIIARQDTSPSELKQLTEKYSKIVEKSNGEIVKTLDGLITELRKKRAGDSIEIEILRNEQYIILDFELDLRPSDV